jgi:hypothetical protein
MIQMKFRGISSLIVSYPLAVRVNVRRVGMTFRVFKTASRAGSGMFVLPWRRRVPYRWRSLRRGITSADMFLSSFMVFLVLRINTASANQQYPQTAYNYLFHNLSPNWIYQPTIKTLSLV